MQYWQEIIAIILSGGALFVSKQAYHKSRAIYDIAKYKFPKQIGDRLVIVRQRTISVSRMLCVKNSELVSGRSCIFTRSQQIR